jgi:hypothetical protein
LTGPYNPTEAGDFFNFSDQSLKHGSPVIEFQNQGRTQITRAIPLEWDPRQFGGDVDHPVIWDTLVLGKDLELNFNNLGAVAKYKSDLVLPHALFGVFAIPAGYLNSNFNRYWTYDAKSKVLVEVTSAMPDGCPALLNDSFGGYTFTVNFGGIIHDRFIGSDRYGRLRCEFVAWRFTFLLRDVEILLLGRRTIRNGR